MKPFTPLICDLCNGSLVMDDSRQFATCEYCGTKYMASTLRAKVMEIKGNVKIDGPVEVFMGDAEKERLLRNAETHIRLKEYDKAAADYLTVIDKYSEDYRGYFGVFKLPIINYFENKRDEFSTNFRYANFTHTPNMNYLKKAVVLCSDKNVINSFFDWIAVSYTGPLHTISCNRQFSFCFDSNLNYINCSTIDVITAWLIFYQNDILQLVDSEKFAFFVNSLFSQYNTEISHKSIIPIWITSIPHHSGGFRSPSSHTHYEFKSFQDKYDILNKSLGPYNFKLSKRTWNDKLLKKKHFEIDIEKRVNKKVFILRNVGSCELIDGTWLKLTGDLGTGIITF